MKENRCLINELLLQSWVTENQEILVHVLLEAFEAYDNYFCEKLFENQMAKPLECNDTFLKSYRSNLVGHFDLHRYHFEIGHPVLCVFQKLGDHETLIKSY